MDHPERLQRLLDHDVHPDHRAAFESPDGIGRPATVDDLHHFYDGLDVDDHQAVEELYNHRIEVAALWPTDCEERGFHAGARQHRQVLRGLMGLSPRRPTAPAVTGPQTRRRGAGRPRAQATRRSSTSRDDGDSSDEDPASPSGGVAP
jgi:hypothetical protein